MGVILIAFERESEQSALEQLLSGRGHQVVRSNNGLAALEVARRDPPHAVISDIVLPRMDGFALCRKWKQDEKLQSVPFLFYTRRHDDPKYERFALELGAERFLSRTATPDALLGALDELLVNDVPREPTVQMPRPNAAALKRAEIEQAQQAQQAQAQAQAQQAQAQLQAQMQTQFQSQLQAQAQAHARALEEARAGQEQLKAQLEELEAGHQRLAAGEARFRRVFEANPLPMWIADCETGGFIAVNESALKLFGYTRAEFLALTGAALESEEQGHEARGHRRKDGTVLQLALTSSPLEFDGRRADLVSGYDLTARAAEEHRLEGLLELFRQADSLDELAIVQRALEQAAEVSGSPHAYLYFVDPGHQTLTLAGWHDRHRRHTSAPPAEPQPLARMAPYAECVRRQRAVTDNDASATLEGDGLPAQQRFIVAPMLAEGEVVALLGVANREAPYAPADEQSLALLADGVWRVLHGWHTRVQTLSALQRTDVALQGMMDSMVRMVERHDPFTAGSARRLAALTVALAREMGLDGERQHALRVAALLHDVGNVAVPPSILAKPGPLTESELALMRTHVEEGCQLLADIDFGAPVADIIYQSHERHDGSGYPRGLKGEDILPEARILAVADTVEAMCSPRPYRPAAGMEAAIEEINRGAGRLFDPDVVTACTRLVRERGFDLPH